MAVTPTPAFVQTPKIAWTVVATPDTETTSKMHDGTATIDTYIQTAFTAGSNGSYIESVKAVSLGTNVASVLRLWINNGSTNATAANNALYKEVALPATTIDEDAALSEVEILLGINLPATYKILAGVGTTVAAGWKITVLGADY